MSTPASFLIFLNRFCKADNLVSFSCGKKSECRRMLSKSAFIRESAANSGEYSCNCRCCSLSSFALSMSTFSRMIFHYHHHYWPSLRLSVREMNSVPTEASTVVSNGNTIGSAPPFCRLLLPPPHLSSKIRSHRLEPTERCRSIKK